MERWSHGQRVLAFGLTEFVPMPIVDGVIQHHVLRAAYTAVGRDHGHEFEVSVLDVLARPQGNLVLGCLAAMVLWPLKKLLRTVFFVLMVKASVDLGAEALLRTTMVHEACRQGWLPGDPARVRAAMEATLKGGRWSPVMRALRGLRNRLEHEALPSASLAPLVHTLHTRAGVADALEEFRAHFHAAGNTGIEGSPARSRP